jgi:uncharacterized protein YdhG (YjbR/CyaY superfamily)
MIPNEVDRYIIAFPPDVRERLEILRETIRQAAPEAKEIMSYGMPAFKMKRILIYYAAFKNHIGFYPTPSGIEAFKQEFKALKWSKGAVQFPHDQPLPLDLVERIVKFRVQEDSASS